MPRTKNTELYQRLDTILGANLKRIRKNRQLRRQDIGDILGVSAQQISKFESGRDRIRGNTIALLAAKFNISVGEFFTGLKVKRA